ncbi:MAG: DMT family transporter [Alphaproteobacteria bacterium]|nr:MAG: DMT family transporter [Alphaproteobacteria bacterium]
MMTGLTVGDRTSADYVRGALYGLAAVSIWSGWIVVARLGLRTSLTPWIGLAAIVLGGGAPVLLANAGLQFAPAAHAGALFPGVMPLAVAILAAFVLREAFSGVKRIGFVLILLGVLGIAWEAVDATSIVPTIGHALFLGSALAWACYTVAMRRARLDGLHAAAIAAVGALILYMPLYLLAAGVTLIKAPWGDLALQAFVQGLLTAIVSLVLYGRAVSLLGASSGAAFAALSPAMTAIMAIPILGEWPTPMDWIAIVAISLGVYIVSGGPTPQRPPAAVAKLT